MKKAILLLFLACSALAIAQDKSAKPEAKPEAAAPAPAKTYRQLDSDYKDGVYENRYFGFTYKLPTGWESRDEETKKRLLEMGSERVKGETAKNPQPGAEQGFFMLILASPKDVLFPQVTLMAQDVVLVPQVKNGSDFIELLNAQFKTQPGYEQVKETEKLMVGQQEFYKSEFKNGKIMQAAVFTVMRRHAVGFIISAAKDEDMKTLLDSVQKMQFQAPKEATGAN